MRRSILTFASAALVVAACNDPPPAGTTSGATSAATTVTIPPASASVTTPEPSAEPTASAAIVGPKGDPAEDAGTKPPGKGDAGAAKDAGAKPAKDAGATASTDAGTAGTPSAEPVTPPIEAPASGSADAVAAEVDKIFVGKKTYTAKFKQEYTQKVSGNVKKSTGTVFVDKPNKISFRYDPPNKNRIVSDGSILKVYVADDSQMFESPVANTEYPGALAFIMGKGLRPSFTFTFNEAAKKSFTGGPVLTGKPRVATPHYESVFFYVDQALLEKGDPGVIRRVLILDAQGNKNRFDFEGASQPASVDASEFTFTPPPGTNITQK